MWLCEISDIVDVLALGKPQISLVVTDSWNKVLNKTGKR
jgi:hypothetical protein